MTTQDPTNFTKLIFPSCLMSSAPGFNKLVILTTLLSLSILSVYSDSNPFLASMICAGLPGDDYTSDIYLLTSGYVTGDMWLCDTSDMVLCN